MVVISPLIALMQDQVAQLTQMGIAAGMLNSSLDACAAVARDAGGGAKGSIGCCICRRSGWRGRIRWSG